jgi:peptidoglycan-associated lipoprotein
MVAVACSRNPPPEPPDTPPLPPAVIDNVPEPPPPPVEPEPPATPPPPTFEPEEDLVTRSLEELNQDSPLQPVFFAYDSAEVDSESRRVLDQNAEVLRRNPNWVVTIEGHCDERGTAEYNLALGERRAVAARQYLVEIGLSPDRLRTVSYGKEFPFDPGSNETAWRQNRRAHLVISQQ